MKQEFVCPKCEYKETKRGSCPTCKIALEQVCAGCGKIQSECDC